MDTKIDIDFKVTPQEKKAIDQRVEENGFDSVASYLKVVALKSPQYEIPLKQSESQDATLDIHLEVTPEQKALMEQKAKENACDDLITYLKFVALNAVVGVTIEVRSSGTLDDMLKRIASQKGK